MIKNTRNNINYGERFAFYTKKAKYLIGISVFFSLTLSALSLIFPMIWANIISILLCSDKTSSYSKVIKYVIIFIGLELFEGIINIIKNYVYSQLEERVSSNIRKDMFSKIISLENKAFDRNRVTYFTDKITSKPHEVITSYMKIIGLVINIIKVCTLITISYVLLLDIGIIFTVVALIIYFSISKIEPFMAKNARLLMMQGEEYNNKLFDFIRNIREIKCLGAKKIVKKEFSLDSADLEKRILSAKNVDNLMNLLLFTLKFSLHTLVLIISTYYYFQNKVGFDAIVILEVYSAILFNSTKQIAEIKKVIMDYKKSLKAIFDILTSKSYESEKFGNIKETKGKGDLIVKNVSFVLPNRMMVLDDINFEIIRNSKVAIVDKGGNSKQILLKLLLRQYEPSEGRIMLDDVNIKDFTEEALRKHIMLVSENTFILNDTLLNNIKIVKPDVKDEEVAKVCADVGIIKWFKNETLKDILNVMLGDYGMKLSEAQKQLIAIARVILQNPDIVVIEEAQNDFGGDDAFAIKKALDKITDSTVLIFSERITSISVCDEIITLAATKFGVSKITRDVIRDNFYGMIKKVSDNKNYEVENEDKNVRKNNKKKDNEDDFVIDMNKNIEEIINETYNDEEIDDDNDNMLVEDIKNIRKINMQKKGAKKDEQHRIFSQIW